MKKNKLFPLMKVIFCISFLSLNGCGGSGSSPEIPEPTPVQPPSFYWEVSTPEEQGMDSNKVKEIVEYC